MDISVLINTAPPANAGTADNRTNTSDTGRDFAEQLAAAGSVTDDSTASSERVTPTPSGRDRPLDSDLATETPADGVTEDSQALAEALLVPVPIHITQPQVPGGDTVGLGTAGSNTAGLDATPHPLSGQSFANQPLAVQQQTWLARVATDAENTIKGVPLNDSLNIARQRLQLMADANGRFQGPPAPGEGPLQLSGIQASQPTTSPEALAAALAWRSPSNAHLALTATPLTNGKPPLDLSQRTPPETPDHPVGTVITQTGTSPLSHVPSTTVDPTTQTLASQSVPVDSSGDNSISTSVDVDSDFSMTSLAQSGPASRNATPMAMTSVASSINTHIDSPDWPQQLGHTLTRIGIATNGRDGDQRIELRLHPEELGPLSVSLRLGEHGAQAQFVSAHPHVRQAVEQALPQLREILSEQGIQLGQASVSDQGQAQQGNGGERQGSSASLAASGGAGEVSIEGNDHPITHTAALSIDGRVDLYA